MTNPEEIAQSDSLKTSEEGIITGEIGTSTRILEKFKVYCENRLERYRPNEYNFSLTIERENRDRIQPGDNLAIRCVLKNSNNQSLVIGITRGQMDAFPNSPFVFALYEICKTLETQILNTAFSIICGKEYMDAVAAEKERNKENENGSGES